MEIRLEATSESRTRLQLEHAAVVPQEMWTEFGPGGVGVGWDLVLLGLARHLTGVDVSDDERSESNPELRRCMTASSEAWGEALRASGADPETVERAVAATTSFYVPTPD